MQRNIVEVSRIFFTGLGQIMLQCSPVTGALFLIGISLNSPVMAVGASLGTIVGMAAGGFLKLSPENQKNGLYGFNAALVGIAAFCFFPLSAWSLLLLVGGAFLSVVVMETMMRHLRVPPYTAPFILVTWGLLWVGRVIPLAPAHTGNGYSWLPDLPLGGLTGLGQVMFQENALSGAFFLVGILACSKLRGLWALAGSLIAGAIAVASGQPGVKVAMGLFGYNAALTALALSSIAVPAFVVMIGAALTVPLVLASAALNISPLTAPFVIATWLTVMFLKLTRKVGSMSTQP
ncbi:MAG: urea transporter [bacterium]